MAPRLHVIAIALCALGAHACREPSVQSATTAFHIDSAELDFGTIETGATGSRVVRITNVGTAPVLVSPRTALPFIAASTEQVIEAGAALSFEILFASPEPGLFEGNLIVSSENAVSTVKLRGRAVVLAQACPASPCESMTVGNDGRCTPTPVLDGMACELACIVDGTCRAGVCVGAPRSCDDDNACTLDACGSGGCVHSARSCESEDPCLAALCDADTGCATTPAADGTPCGPSDCSSARVCLSGVCSTRVPPDGAACHPTPCSRGQCSAGECTNVVDQALSTRITYRANGPIAHDFFGAASRAGSQFFLEYASLYSPTPQTLVSISLDGGVRWRSTVANVGPRNSQFQSVLVTDSAVIAYRDPNGGAIKALSPSDGRTLWSSNVNLLVDRREYFDGGRIASVDLAPSDGGVFALFHLEAPLRHDGTRCDPERRAIFGSLHPLTGVLQWRTVLTACGVGEFVADDRGTAYVRNVDVDGGNALYAFASDGRELWRRPIGSFVRAAAHGIVASAANELISSDGAAVASVPISPVQVSELATWGNEAVPSSRFAAVSTSAPHLLLSRDPFARGAPFGTTEEGWSLELVPAYFSDAAALSMPAMIRGRGLDGGSWACTVELPDAGLNVGSGGLFDGTAVFSAEIIPCWDCHDAFPVDVIISVDLPGVSQAKGDWPARTGGRRTNAPW